MLIGCIYRPPDISVEHVNTSLKRVRRLLDAKKFTGCIIVGDFNLYNIDWSSCGTALLKKDDSDSESFITTIRDSLLFQHVFEPTFQTDIGVLTNTLDLVLSEMPDRVFSVRTGQPLGLLSKCHLSLCFNFSIASLSVPNKIGRKFCFGKADYDSLNAFFREIDWVAQLKSSNDIDDCYHTFLNKYNEGCSKFIKIIDTNVASKWPSWLSSDLKRAIKLKRALWRKLKSNNFRSILLKIMYNNKCNQVIKLTKNAVREHEKRLASLAKANPKLIYAYVNSKRLVRGGIHSLKVGDSYNYTSETQEIADILNSEFQSSFSSNVVVSLPDFSNLTESECIVEPEISFDINSVKKKLDQLDKHKSNGVDDVHPHVLNSCSDSLALPLSLLFRTSFNLGKLPRLWKLANVTPIHKKGSRCDQANYRPISLTSIVCRVSESLIREIIEAHLTLNNLIVKQQHGFMRGKSCATNLLESLDIITASLEKHLPVDILFTDFRSAFNKVSHRLLVEVKLPAYGIRGKLLNWIRDFLTDRQQRVVLCGVTSKWLCVSSGVPQGSVLGPVLFIIFINDLAAKLVNNPKLFADDTKLIGVISDESSTASIQLDLDTIATWCKTWLMELNEKKCKVMHIGHRNPKTNYAINGVDLTKTTLEKDLGVWISSDLKPSHHIDSAVCTANKVWGQIKHSFRYITCKSFKLLFCSLVRPHLEYGACVWTPFLKKDIAKLENMQRRATKHVFGLGKLS